MTLEGSRDDNPDDVVLVEARPLGAGRTRRIWAVVVMLVCLSVLGVAAWLKPDPRGFGTHQQLGLGKCGMLVTTGLFAASK